METGLLVLGIGLVAGLLGGFLTAFGVIRSSGPVVTAKALNELSRIRLEWDGWRTGAEAVLSSVEELEEVIERKRSRYAAREAKEKARMNGTENPNDKAVLIRRARELGIPGI